MSYYRFRACDISAASARGGKSRKSRSPPIANGSPSIRQPARNGAGRDTPGRIPRSLRFANDLLPTAPARKMVRLCRGDRRRAAFIVRDEELAETSEAITRLPARESLEVSDYFRELLR